MLWKHFWELCEIHELVLVRRMWPVTSWELERSSFFERYWACLHCKSVSASHTHTYIAPKPVRVKHLSVQMSIRPSRCHTTTHWTCLLTEADLGNESNYEALVQVFLGRKKQDDTSAQPRRPHASSDSTTNTIWDLTTFLNRQFKATKGNSPQNYSS